MPVCVPAYVCACFSGAGSGLCVSVRGVQRGRKSQTDEQSTRERQMKRHTDIIETRGKKTQRDKAPAATNTQLGSAYAGYVDEKKKMEWKHLKPMKERKKKPGGCGEEKKKNPNS